MKLKNAKFKCLLKGTGVIVLKKIILWVTVIMAVTAVFSYMEKQEETVLKAAYPQRMDIKNVLTINGTVKENNRKDIYLDEMAEIKEIYVKPGDYVKKGDVIAELHPSMGGIEQAEKAFLSALTFSEECPQKAELIYEVVK